MQYKGGARIVNKMAELPETVFSEIARAFASGGISEADGPFNSTDYVDHPVPDAHSFAPIGREITGSYGSRSAETRAVRELSLHVVAPTPLRPHPRSRPGLERSSPAI